jgi:hypothetical protein
VTVTAAAITQDLDIGNYPIDSGANAFRASEYVQCSNSLTKLGNATTDTGGCWGAPLHHGRGGGELCYGAVRVDRPERHARATKLLAGSLVLLFERAAAERYGHIRSDLDVGRVFAWFGPFVRLW